MQNEHLCKEERKRKKEKQKRERNQTINGGKQVGQVVRCPALPLRQIINKTCRSVGVVCASAAARQAAGAAVRSKSELGGIPQTGPACPTARGAKAPDDAGLRIGPRRVQNCLFFCCVMPNVGQPCLLVSVSWVFWL